VLHNRLTCRGPHALPVCAARLVAGDDGVADAKGGVKKRVDGAAAASARTPVPTHMVRSFRDVRSRCGGCAALTWARGCVRLR
jgi:hypothetical protein